LQFVIAIETAAFPPHYEQNTKKKHFPFPGQTRKQTKNGKL